MQLPRLSVVIPLHREGLHVQTSLEAIAAGLGSLPKDVGQEYEFILVDDGSPDNTWEAMQAFASRHPRVQCLRFSRNFGKEAAIHAGLLHARGAAVIVMDGDLQHPPVLIPEMVRLWHEEGYEVVEAVKTIRSDESFAYRLGVRVFNFLLWRLSGFDLRGSSDFKLLDRRVVDALLGLEEQQTFYRGLVAWLGFSRVQIPMHVAPRVAGKSSWRLFKLVRLATTALTSFSTILLHTVTVAGLLFFAGSLVLAAHTLWQWAAGAAVPGFSTVILLQLIIGSILMLSLGIIGEYLSRIYVEVKRRPRYVIAESLPGSNRP